MRARYLAIPLLAGFALAVVFAVVPALGADHAVTVSSNVFTPKTMTVSQGDSVTWTNTSGSHNVRFDDGSFDEPADPISGGWTAKRTFNSPGTFRYYCEEHGAAGGIGMSGTVVVNAPGGTLPTQPGTTSPGNTTPQPVQAVRFIRADRRPLLASARRTAARLFLRSASASAGCGRQHAQRSS